MLLQYIEAYGGTYILYILYIYTSIPNVWVKTYFPRPIIVLCIAMGIHFSTRGFTPPPAQLQPHPASAFFFHIMYFIISWSTRPMIEESGSIIAARILYHIIHNIVRRGLPFNMYILYNDVYSACVQSHINRLSVGRATHTRPKINSDGFRVGHFSSSSYI